MHDETASDVNLLDVLLYALPVVTVVNDSLWQKLALGDRSSIRQCCRSGRQLSDLLTHAVTFIMRSSQEKGPYVCQLGACCAFTARLERLTALKLVAWSAEDALMAALGRLGHASVTDLTLFGPTLSERASVAVLATFPHLSKLTLDATEAAGEGGGDSREGDERMQLIDQAFLPLQSSMLTQLVVRLGRDNHPARHLVDLGAVTRLRHLDLTIDGDVPPDALLPLAALVHLHTCIICLSQTPVCRDRPALADLSPLLALTHLQRLRFWPVMHHTPALQAAPGVADALRLLRGLTQLECLKLGRHFEADDVALATLDCLGRLTRLEVGGLRIAHAASGTQAGHLAVLHRLVLPHDAAKPSCLLQLLLPLQPHKHLTHLERGGRDGMPDGAGAAESELRLDVMCCGAGEAANQAGALWSLASVLCQAPHLVLNSVVLSTWVANEATASSRGGDLGSDEPAPRTLSLLAIAASLRPLSDRIFCLDLGGGRGVFPDDGHWHALCKALPYLQRLRLPGAPVTEMGAGCLAAVGGRLTALRRLDFHHTCTEVSLLGLAASVCHPLALHFACHQVPGTGVVAVVEGAEEHAHGCLHLTFHEGSWV